MLAIAARRMGYRVHCFSPDRDSPTGQIADREVVAAYDDLETVARFADDVDVVTFEFENVPSATADVLRAHVPVRPSPSVLHTTQNRVREKRFLSDIGVPVTPFEVVSSPSELAHAVERLGTPAVLKTAAFGYDGKGQVRVDATRPSADLWRELSEGRLERDSSTPAPLEAVLEAFVDFRAEISVVAARALDGSTVAYDVVENVHRRHILDVSIVPARIAPAVAERAVAVAKRVLEALDVIGVMCVEMFLTRDDALLVNELAPRPHNSGHFSFDACVTSQFEQQLRAVCGLPLGSPRLLAPCAMVNLLGELWADGEPAWDKACAFPDVKVHLYGKATPKPGRKMGHLTALAGSADEAEALAVAARSALTTR